MLQVCQHLSPAAKPAEQPQPQPVAAATAPEGRGNQGTPWPAGTAPPHPSLPRGGSPGQRLGPGSRDRGAHGAPLSPFWKDLLRPRRERDSAGRAQAGAQETGASLPALPSPCTTPGKSLPRSSRGGAGLRPRVRTAPVQRQAPVLLWDWSLLLSPRAATPAPLPATPALLIASALPALRRTHLIISA